jgi:hypothetical protein
VINADVADVTKQRNGYVKQTAPFILNLETKWRCVDRARTGLFTPDENDLLQLNMGLCEWATG